MTTFRFDPDDDGSTASLGDIENYFQENGSQADRLPNSGDTVESHHTGAVTGSIRVDRWTNGINLLSGSFTASFADTVVASGGASVDLDRVEDLFLSGSASAEIGSAITVNLRGDATATVGSIDFNRFGVSTTFGAVIVLEGSSLTCPNIESSSDVGLETVVEGTLETVTYEGGVGLISRVTIMNGGSMTVSSFGLGSQAEDEETLQIVGSGSSLSYGGALVIGDAGDGQLLIRDGASQTFTSIVVAKQASSGNQAVSSVANGIHVQGAGSKLSVANSLAIGQRGDGHLSLLDGAQVTVGAALRLADAAGSGGTVSIGNSFTGAGRSTLIVIGDLTGGSGASGIFLDSGGSLDVKGNIQLGLGGTATGSSGVRDTGSRIAAGGDFLLGVGGKHALGLQGGASVEVAGDFVLGSGANGEGTLTVSTGLGKTPDAPIAVKTNVMQVGGLGTGTVNVFAGVQLKMAGTDVWLGAKAGSSGTVSIAGKDADGRAASVSTDALIVGALGEGELNVLNGAVLRSTSGLIGEQDTGKGTALVSGVDSLWVSRKGFSVGDEGEGSLKIELGGKAQITKGDLAVGRLAESSGEVVVDGKGSLLALGEALVAIGNEGEGKLTISNGGRVQLTTVDGATKGPIQIGFDAGSSGSVLLMGKGSNLQVGGTGEVVVANAGEGALSLANNARLEAASIHAALSQGSNGSMSVRGKGSVLEADSFHFTGEGAADCDILGGGMLKSRAVLISTVAGGSAEVSVSGAGSALSILQGSSGLIVEGQKTAILSVANGGKIELGKSTSFGIAFGAGTSAQVLAEGEGSLIDAQNALNSVGGRGQGRLSIVDGADFIGGEEMQVGARAGSNGSVKIDGAGSTLSTDFLAIGGTGLNTGGLARFAVSNGGEAVISSKATLWQKGTIEVSRTGSFEIGAADGRSGAVSIGADGVLQGAGAIKASLHNDGTVQARNGSLDLIGGSLDGDGVLDILKGAELDLARSTGLGETGVLHIAGTLTLGARSLVVTESYSNTNWGAGNAFDPRAGIAGSGDIIGRGADLDVTGPRVSHTGNTVIVRLTEGADGLLHGSFGIENSGTGVEITTAIQTLGLSGGALTGVRAGNVVLDQGESKVFEISFDPSKGSLASQSLQILSNFDNVAPIKVKFTGTSDTLNATTGADLQDTGLPEAFEIVTLDRGYLADGLGLF